VATDVAARGIHVEDLPCVVHYDPPADHTDYLHRSGRTGRAGKTGIVVSLVADEQVPANKVLQRSLGFATVLHAREASKSVGQGSRVATLGSVERPRVGTSTSPRGSITSSPRRPRSDVGRRSDGAPVGTVKFFDAKRGYGFLSRPDGTGDVFVHASSIQGIGPSVLRPGQQVRFQMTTGRKGDEACNVMVI